MQQLGADSAGIWRRSEALSVVRRGVERGQRYDGAWVSPYPGVLADGGVEMSPERWAFAGVLASGGRLLEERPEGIEQLGAVACARDAARVWEVPLVDDDDPATGRRDHLQHDVAVWTHARPLRSRRPDDDVHVLHRRQLELAADDVVRHASGLWLTTAVRTAYDLTAVLRPEALVCALDDLLHRELVTAEELQEAAELRKGWRHGPAFRHAVSLADGRAESPHETLTRLLLLPSWPALVPQVELADGVGGVVARFDLADEQLRLAVESDGKRWHGGEASRARDGRRDRRTTAYRWTVERVTWWEVRVRAEQTRRRLLAARDRRARELVA